MVSCGAGTSSAGSIGAIIYINNVKTIEYTQISFKNED